MDGRNHSGRTRQDECESTEAVKHTRVREKARVRERVPDGLRPDGEEVVDVAGLALGGGVVIEQREH